MHLNNITNHLKGQQIILSELLEIQPLKRFDKSIRFITKVLGRSHSTINVEIKRGTTIQKKLINGKVFYLKAYNAETSQLVYKKHREACKPYYKLLKVEQFIPNAKQKIQERSGSYHGRSSD